MCTVEAVLGGAPVAVRLPAAVAAAAAVWAWWLGRATEDMATEEEASLPNTRDVDGRTRAGSTLDSVSPPEP